MHNRAEKDRLLNEVDALRRKIIVVSNSFEIPAASARVKDNFGGDIIHRL